METSDPIARVASGARDAFRDPAEGLFPRVQTRF
jgi:hypothetical protein